MIAYEAPTVTLLGRIISRGEHDRSFIAATPTAWVLGITERDNASFDAIIIDPNGGTPYGSHLRATVDEAVEKACDYLRDQLKQPTSAAALRMLALVEIRTAK